MHFSKEEAAKTQDGYIMDCGSHDGFVWGPSVKSLTAGVTDPCWRVQHDTDGTHTLEWNGALEVHELKVKPGVKVEAGDEISFHYGPDYERLARLYVD